MFKKKEQYVVTVPKDERKAFILYLLDLGINKYSNIPDEMIESHWPIVIEPDRHLAYLLNSVTCCALTTQAGKMLTVNKFKEIIENR